MKQFLTGVCSLFFLTSCYYKATKFPEQTKLPDGLYSGSNGWNLVFVKISNDSAYADFIHIEKFPRELHSDTLQFDDASQSWKSNKGSLTQNGVYYSITTKYNCETCSQPVPVTINQKIKTDKKLTQAYIDTYKNYAFLNMKQHEHMIKSRPNKVHPVFYYLNDKHMFLDSIDLMTHTQFLVAYKNYEEEMKKRRPQ